LWLAIYESPPNIRLGRIEIRLKASTVDANIGKKIVLPFGRTSKGILTNRRLKVKYYRIFYYLIYIPSKCV